MYNFKCDHVKVLNASTNDYIKRVSLQLVCQCVQSEVKN